MCNCKYCESDGGNEEFDSWMFAVRAARKRARRPSEVLEGDILLILDYITHLEQELGFPNS